MNRLFAVFTFSLAFYSCASRAPTTHELDSRSGLYGNATTEPAYDRELATAQNQKMLAKENGAPLRVSPLVTKVWIHDQALEGGHWLAGTWAFIEVEPSRWLRTPDVPGADLAEPVSGSINSRFQPGRAVPKNTPTPRPTKGGAQ